MGLTEAVAVALALPVMGFPFAVGLRNPEGFSRASMMFGGGATALAAFVMIASGLYSFGAMHQRAAISAELAGSVAISGDTVEILSLGESFALVVLAIAYNIALQVFDHFMVRPALDKNRDNDQ